MRNTRRSGRGKRPSTNHLPLTGAIMTALLGLQAQGAGSQTLAPGALPVNGQVVQGTASITKSGNAMTVLQQSGKLITNWDSFNIGPAARVDFVQPSSSSMALNRVLLGDPSRIYGQLNANGQLFLVNPAGVLFAPGSRVNVGGIIASALDISNADFAAGNFRFAGGAQATGEVANAGEITTTDKGYAALLGPRVSNAGSIVARMGTVALAAGNAVTLDLHGDRLINLQIDSAAAQALAANSGALRADGGLVLLAANSAGDPLATVLNNTGTIHSTTLANVNGVIRLEGGGSGVVSVSGTLDASGKGAGETGGTVKVLGDKVGLFDGARIDASGNAGGGTILVGGNWQGSGTEQRASATFVGEGATLAADAIAGGNGGKIVVWSDGSTRYYGGISAQGGAAGGNGGAAEVSGKLFLDYNGLANLGALRGDAGSLLLDPTNISISAGTNAATWNGTNTFTGTGTTSILNVTTLLNQLALSDVIVSTASSGGGSGDITVASAIGYTGGNSRSLSLLATRDINISADITSSNAALNLTLSAATGRVAVGLNDGTQKVISTNGGNIAMNGIGRTGAANGILIQGASISSGAGNISMTGTGSAGSQGVSFSTTSVVTGLANVVEATTGSISITGVNNATGSGIGINNNSNTIRTTGTVAGQGGITLLGQSTQAGGSIGVTMGSSGVNGISTVAGNISITGESASDSSAISVASGQNTIKSTGTGNVTLNGTASGTGNGIATSAGVNAIGVASGALVMNGSATGTGNGISLGTGTLSISASGGNLTLNGTASSAGGSGVVFSSGTATSATNVLLNTSGNLNINGINTNGAATSGAAGIAAIGSLGSTTLQTGSGNINLTGTAGGAATGVKLAPTNTATLLVRTTGAGATTVTANTVTLDRTTLQSTGGGSVVLQPLSAGTSVGLGNGAGTFSLDAAELATLADGFSSITIGRSDGTGLVSVGAATLTDNLVLRQQGGGMTFTGALTLGANSLSISSGGGAIANVQLASAGNVGITAAGAVSLGTSAIGGTLAVTSGGAITQTNAFSVAGATTLSAGASSNITLSSALNDFVGAVNVLQARDVSLADANNLQVGNVSAGRDLSLSAQSGAISQAAGSTITATGGTVTLSTGGGAAALAEDANDFASVAINGAGNVSLKDSNAIILAASTIGGTFSVAAGGLVSQSGALNITGGLNVTTSQVAGDVTVNNAGAATTTLGNTQVGNDFTLTSGGDITQAAGTRLVIGNNFSVSGGSLGAPEAGNVIGGSDNSGGGGTVVRKVGVVNLATTDIGAAGGAGDITTAGALSVLSLASADVIQARVGAGTTAVNLASFSNNIGGPISITASAPTVIPSGAAVATGIVQNGATINVGGNASFSAATSSMNAGGKAGDITLDGTANQFGGTVGFSGNNVLIHSAGAIAIGGASATGTLGLHAHNGGISGSGLITVLGDAGFVADGGGRDIVLDNANNNFGGSVSFAGAGGLANVSISDSTALDLQALTLSGNLVARGAVITDSGSLSVGGTTTLQSAGSVVLDNSGHSFGNAVSVNAAAADIRSGGALQLAASTVTGDLALTAGGALTQSGALTVSGNLALTTTHNAGNVTLDTSAGAATRLGNSTVGGNLDITATGKAVTQDAGSALNVAGNLNTSGTSSTTTSPADNLIGGVDGTQGANKFIRQVGVVTLGDITSSGNLTVVSQATGQKFDGAAIGGTAINLAGAANSVGGTITINTRAPDIVSTGTAVATGIQQAAGTSLQVTGTAAFTAAGGDVTVANAGNSFTGAVSATGNNITLRGNGALLLGAINAAGTLQANALSGITQNASGIKATGASQFDAGAGALTLTAAANDFGGAVGLANTAGAIAITDTNALALGTVNAAGAFTATAGGMTTLNGNISGTGVTFAGSGAGAVTLANDVSIDARTGNLAMGAMTGGTRNLTLTSDAIALSGNWSGTGAYTLQTASDATSIGLGGGAGTWSLTTAEMANIASASSALVTIGRATGTGTITVAPLSFDDKLALRGGAVNFSAGAQTFGNGLSVTAAGRVQLSGATVTATGGDIVIRGESGSATQGFQMTASSQLRATSGTGSISVTGINNGTSSGVSIGSGTNVIEATGTGNVTVAGTTTDTGGSFGVTMGTGGTNSIRTADGTVTITGKSAGGDTAFSLGTGTNIVEATGSGNLVISGNAAGAGNGVSMGGTGNAFSTNTGSLTITGTSAGAGHGISVSASGSSNAIKSGSGLVRLVGTSTGSGNAVSMSLGTNTVSTAGGNIEIAASALGTGRALSMSAGNNTIAAGGAGKLDIDANAKTGAAVSLGSASSTVGTSVLRVADGAMTIDASTGASGSAFVFGVGSDAKTPATNTIEATLGGSVTIHAMNTGTGNGMTMGTSSNNTIRTAAGQLTVVAESAAATGLSMATGNNVISTTGGSISVTGIAHGDDNGLSMGSTAGASTNLIAAGGAGKLQVTGISEGGTAGFGLSMGSASTNTLRVEDGAMTVRGQSSGQGDATVTAVAIGSGTNRIEATGTGSIDIAGNALGAGNGVALGTGGTNVVSTTSGRLDITGTAAGGGHGVNMGSGVNTLQTTSGALNVNGKALGSGNGFYVSSTGRDSVLTGSGSISITGSSATGDAIAIRPTADVATIAATGPGNISFRADNYDATPTGTGSVRIASNGGELRIVQLTPGTSIGIGEGAQGTLNWSGAEVAQVSGFSLVRIGNSESGALDLRPPWFPFPVVRPPITLSATQQVLNATRTTVESLLSYTALMSIGELPPTLAVTRRFNLLVQGFEDARR